jgi:hypothetical protein
LIVVNLLETFQAIAADIKNIFANKADKTAVVDLTSSQSILGVKTFGVLPVLPSTTPTTATQAATKAYVDIKGVSSGGTAGQMLRKSSSTEGDFNWATIPASTIFNYRGAWVASTAYAVNDILTYGGQTYIVTTAFTSSTTFSATNLGLWAAKGADGLPGVGFLYRGAWAASTVYAVNDVVINGGQTYIVTTAHTSPTTFATTNLGLWAAKGTDGSPGNNGAGFSYKGAWAASTAYSVNDVVTNGGQTYVVTTAHTSPTTFATTNLGLWAAKGTDGTPGNNGSNGVDALKTEYAPSDYGLVAWSTALDGTGSGNALTGLGRLSGARLYLPVATTVSQIQLIIVTLGTSLTSGNCKGAIYDISGNLLATTVDQSTNWATAGVRNCALATPVVLQPGFYDVGIWANGTASPVFGRAGSGSGLNGTLSGQAIRFWRADNGLTTAAPATLGAKSVDTYAWWLGLL